MMNVKAFEYKMVGKSFAILNEDVLIFKAKRGRWEVWNGTTDESRMFDSLKAALSYKPQGKDTVEELINSLESVGLSLDGGRGADSGSFSTFKFGHADLRGQGENGKHDLPARMNVTTKTKTIEGAIAAFRQSVAKEPGREHGISVGEQGFTTQYVHGSRVSVAISSKNRGELIVHNHPSNGSFSDGDLLATAQDTRSTGIVATHSKGYRILTKGNHFNSGLFAKGVKNAQLRGKDYDDAADRWLKKNQKKYGYKFKNIMD